MLIALVMGCSHEKLIDEVFRWPSSGVPEADSLILEMERRTIAIDTPVKGYRDLEIRLCSLAEKYPNNNLLQSRASYIQLYTKSKREYSNDSLLKLIASVKSKLDSSRHTFDWHMWTSLEIDNERDMIKKYIKSTDNILYFEKVRSFYELGRSHVQLGNIMKDYSELEQAKAHYLKAEEIYKNLGYRRNIFICQLNLAPTLSIEDRDRVFLNLINDTSARKLGQLQIWVMQNYALSTGKIEYIDSALQIAANPSYFSETKYIEEVPFLFALKGNYYDQYLGKHLEGKELILQGLDSTNRKEYPFRYLHMMYKMLGATYGNMEYPDSAAFYFYQSLQFRDSLDKELQQAQVLNLDVKNRIELVKQSMQQQRDLWIWGLTSTIVFIILALIILLINHKRRQAVKEFKQLQTQEKLQKSVQSVKIQTMVIEENEKLIDKISEQINELRKNGEIDITSAGALTRIMKLHKTDSEAHKGLLEIQKELSNDFIDKLREDYPSLSEGQLKLASLIAIGVESPQICRMLGIQLSSLHKSRYRLRTRLGLNNDDSLEEFLRSRNKSAI
ncbi:MAG: hypothetical protein HDR88_14345 [Bacteroides sp.]|nr:hypothetical protein [Bacteroides sp.]